MDNKSWLPTPEEFEELKLQSGMLRKSKLENNNLEITDVNIIIDKCNCIEPCENCECQINTSKVIKNIDDIKKDVIKFYEDLKNEVDEDDDEDDDIEENDSEFYKALKNEIGEDGFDEDDIDDIKIPVTSLSEHCNGCHKIIDGKCTVYAEPKIMMRWVDGKSNSGCSFNRHNLVKVDDKKSKEKIRVGQQKQKSKK